MKERGENDESKKIGLYLKELRNRQGHTQEQLSEILGVSSRSISRWENGVNMPDLDLLLDISKYYEVSIDELLYGERNRVKMGKNTETIVSKIANYDKELSQNFSRKMRTFFSVALIALTTYIIIDMIGLRGNILYDGLSGFLIGLVLGIIILGILYTTSRLVEFREFKIRIYKKLKGKLKLKTFS